MKIWNTFLFFTFRHKKKVFPKILGNAFIGFLLSGCGLFDASIHNYNLAVQLDKKVIEINEGEKADFNMKFINEVTGDVQYSWRLTEVHPEASSSAVLWEPVSPSEYFVVAQGQGSMAQTLDNVNLELQSLHLTSYDMDREFKLEIYDITDGRSEGAPQEAIIRVKNLDDVPKVIVESAEVLEGENAIIKFKLDKESLSKVVVQWSAHSMGIGPTFAIPAIDFLSLSGTTVTFPARALETNGIVTTLNNGVYNLDKLFRVTIAGADGAELVLGSHQATVTIKNVNDKPKVYISGSPTVSESAGQVQIPVSLSSVAGVPVTVTWETFDMMALPAYQRALAGTNYTATSGSLTINPGDTVGYMTVPILDDATRNQTLYLGARLLTTDYAEIGTDPGEQEGKAGILDNDGYAQVSISSSQSDVYEGASLPVTVSLTDSLSSFPISVKWRIVPIDMINPPSHFSAMTGTVTIPANSLSQNFSIPTLNDGLFKVDQTFKVVIDSVDFAQINPAAPETGTITLKMTPANLAQKPVLSIVPAASAIEGEEVVFVVSLSQASGSNTVFNWAAVESSPISARVNVDFLPVSGMNIVIPAGQTTVELHVPTVDNLISQYSRTFSVNITGLTNADAGNLQGIGEILDNDSDPTVTFVLASSTVPETIGTVTVAMQLSTISQKAISVPLLLSGSATLGLDYKNVPATVNFAPGENYKEFTFDVINNTTFQDDRLLIIGLDTPTNAGLGAIDEHTVTILDDDVPPILTVNDIRIYANGPNTPGEFTFTLSEPAGKDVTITYATRDGSATAPADYTSASSAETGDFVIPAGTVSKTLKVFSNRAIGMIGTWDFYLDILSVVNANYSAGFATAIIEAPSAPEVDGVTVDNGTYPYTIVIDGDNFLPGVDVIVGGEPCANIVIISPTQIQCNPTVEVIGDHDIEVINYDGQTDTIPDGFTYVSRPRVDSLGTPNMSATGQELLTLTGYDFHPGMTITVGGAACTSVNIISISQASCITPAGAVGLKNIVVTNIDAKTYTLANGVNYISTNPGTWEGTGAPNYNLATGAPTARYAASSVWAGNMMVVWGGVDLNGAVLGTGGRFDPVTNAWYAVSTTGSPSARAHHTATWAKGKMYIWGGYNGGVVGLGDGAAYDPVANTWTAMSATGAPGPRYYHSAVWTEDRLIIFGGYSSASLNTGGEYDPATNTWATLGAGGTGLPSPRYLQTAVWAEGRMIIWGGSNGVSALGDGKMYDPMARAWSDISSTGQPGARYQHTAVWTGSYMVVWGGRYASDLTVTTNAYNDGGRFNPRTNTWSPITTSGAPLARFVHSAVWTGQHMVIFGGMRSWRESDWKESCVVYHRPWEPGHYGTYTYWQPKAAVTVEVWNDGAVYNPETNSWSALPTPSPGIAARHSASVAWTGRNMIVWGGYYRDNAASYLRSYGIPAAGGSGGYYDASNCGGGINSQGSYPRAYMAGYPNLVWSDGRKIASISSIPAAGTWIGTTTTTAPTARFGHTSLWTGNKMVVWGGRDGTSYVNTGAIFDPVTNSWAATSTASAPSARAYHSAVWASGRMLIFGGEDSSGSLAGGYSYDLVANTWSSLSAVGAPGARKDHTAIWTGRSMLIFGGEISGVGLSSGFAYNPATDSWSTLPTANAPTARSKHTAVWTGTHMIIWGGQDGPLYHDTGSVYNAVTNSWTYMPFDVTPTQRANHTAVWTGTQMLIWGGKHPVYISEGARYDLASNTWFNMNSAGAPEPRAYHNAVYANARMFIYGGHSDSAVYGSGYWYNPATDTWSGQAVSPQAPTARSMATMVVTNMIGSSNSIYQATQQGSREYQPTRIIIWGGVNASAQPLATGGIFYLE